MVRPLNKTFFLCVSSLREAAKKVLLKVIFSVMARPFTPPPTLIMAQSLREELFFAASLN